MAELADAHGSGPCERKFMEVQVLLAAPESPTLQTNYGLQGFSFHIGKPLSLVRLLLSVH